MISSMRCVNPECDYRATPRFLISCQMKLERLYIPIHDNLSKIGVANSKTLATSHRFTTVWVCWNHCSLPNGFVMFSAAIPTVPIILPRRNMWSCWNAPSANLFTITERCAKESTWYLHVSCFMFERHWLRDWTQHRHQCKRAQGVLWFGTSLPSYMPHLAAGIINIQHSMSLNPSLQLSSLLCLPRFLPPP
jgi:hypothetical protein